MYKKIILILLLNFIPSIANAEEGFPINYPAEIKPKDFAVNVFYANSFTLDNKIGANEFKGEVKANFLNQNFGIVSEISFQQLLGTNPAIISGIVPQGDVAYTQDGSALIGYQFSLLDNLNVTPFVKARGIVTRGRGGDNIYGPEIGGNIQYQIYPETTNLNIRYGLTIPAIHHYTGMPDTVASRSFLLSNFETRLSYRFLANFDVLVAYNLRTFPKNLGNSNLANNEQLIWTSVLIGVGYVFWEK